MARREWSQLSVPYRKRLERAGITAEAYGHGEPLRRARGHAETPEHPRQAVRNPQRFPRYVRKHLAIEGGESPRLRPIGPEIGHPGRQVVRSVIFERTAGGMTNGEPARMWVIEFDSEGNPVSSTETFYNQRDFRQLIQEAKANGYNTGVTSSPSGMAI